MNSVSKNFFTNGSNNYESILLGAYSKDGHLGMMASSFTARKKAVSIMLGKVGVKQLICLIFWEIRFNL